MLYVNQLVYVIEIGIFLFSIWISIFFLKDNLELKAYLNSSNYAVKWGGKKKHETVLTTKATNEWSWYHGLHYFHNYSRFAYFEIY